MDLKVGDCFYEKKYDNYKYHVVAVLKEEEQIVIKYYGKRKQWWHYEVKSFYEVDMFFTNGLYYQK
ncbi:MAG: hypothetical protein JRJ00_00040 [Deltaproteobacteria bacterium]|nr:hypothetical protein [Deltaproteobacteria bacterium]